MKFLTKAEKLRSTRKYLHMKQEDLTDENITRGFISMLEIGRREISNTAALKFVEKFQKRAKELGIELQVDKDFLLRSPSEDAELYCKKKLEGILEEKDIKEVIEIANKFNLFNIQAIGYSKLGDYYFNKKDFDEAFNNYNNAIDIFKNINQNELTAHLYLRIGNCKAFLLQYTEALSYFHLSYRYAMKYADKDNEIKAIYNMAKCNMKLNKIDLALNDIKKFLSICSKEDDLGKYVYANILKANCYEIKKEFDAAIQIYNSLLVENTDSSNPALGYIYNNLGLAYLNKNDFEKSLKYFSKAEQIKFKTDPYTVSHTIIEKSSVFFKQGLYSDAITLIRSGLEQALINMDYEYLIKGNHELIRIYKIQNDVENLKKTYLDLSYFLEKSSKYNDLVSVFTKLSIIYLDEGNVEEVKKYLLMIQETNRKCCTVDV